MQYSRQFQNFDERKSTSCMIILTIFPESVGAKGMIPSGHIDDEKTETMKYQHDEWLVFIENNKMQGIGEKAI